MRIARSLSSLLLLTVLPAFQGGDRPDRPDQDPPSRVGRVSFLSGSVSRDAWSCIRRLTDLEEGLTDRDRSA